MSADVNEAKALMAEAVQRATKAITDKVITWTDACTAALTALADEIESGPTIPPLDETISAAIASANNALPKMFVCSNCYRRIEEGTPLTVERALPTPRMVHYPTCPNKEDVS